MSRGASPDDVLAIVEGGVRDILGLGPGDAVDRDAPFADLGFDSLAAVELARQIHEATGIDLPLTAGFDHPTPAALAAHVARLLAGDEESASTDAPAEPDSAPEPRGAASPADEDAIAVVGVACRLPGGVGDAAGLWALLDGGRDGTCEFPRDRGWDVESLVSADPDESGTTYVSRGGFLPDALDFDAAFFGISEREAQAMDPQQRLVLEVAWEALEDASIDPGELRGEPVGVFVGLATHDYYGRLAAAVPPELEGWFGIGNAGSVASGRLAYTLGLQGPALTVDTACSSSLVGVHLAAQALRRGECGMALVGGATVLASPALFVEFSRHRGLSPDGRCRSFAESADGTGWSEGAAFLVLEPLGAARRNGHPVLALVRGSAVNQDGASNGLSAPNGLAQEAVIRAALADAGLDPRDVDAIEAHGTATTLGDPIELSALQSVFDDGARGDRPLHVGSLKSNIGHCQAAAGVAGVAKMVLALERERLPATLHVDAPTPKIDWESTSVALLTGAQPWGRAERPRRAGVSAFGISGTNAHVVLEEAPAEGAPTDAGDGVLPLALSGRDDDVVRDAAGRLARHLEAHPDVTAAGTARALAGRHHGARRAVAIGRSRDDLLEQLRGIAAGEPGKAVVGERIADAKLAVLFTGQGSQRLGMGLQLARELDAFGTAFGDVCEALDVHLDRPLRDILAAEKGSAEAALLDRTGWAQPALFAVEVALYRAAEAAGLRPQLLAGHSIGELAAAHVAGVLSLDDASALVAARASLMDALPEGGAMAAVFAPEDEVQRTLPASGELVVAAVNGPSATVVSGAAAALDAWAEEWSRDGRRLSRLRVSHAFHSPLMDPMLDGFREAAERLTYRPASIPIASTATGAIAGDELASAGYWVDQVRRPVRFADAVRALREAGAAVFAEAGPGTVLTQLAEGSVDGDARLVPLLAGARDEMKSFVTGLAQVHAAGVPVRWSALPAVATGRHAHVPPTPFRRRRFWAEPARPAAAHDGDQRPMELAGEDAWVSHERLSARGDAWIADHDVGGAAVVPGTKYVDLALELGRAAGVPVVDELVLHAPLALPEDGALELQLRAGPPDGSGRRPLDVHGREDGHEPWERVAGGRLAPRDAAGDAPPAVQPPRADGTPIDLEELYDVAEGRGLRYGPAFRLVERAWTTADGEVVAELAEGHPARGRVVDPALLDAAMHALALAHADGDAARVPFSWEKVRAHGADEPLARVRLRRTPDDALALDGFSAGGEHVVAIAGVHGRPLVDDDGVRAGAQARRRMFELAWGSMPGEEATPPRGLRSFTASPDAWPAVDELLDAARGGDDVVVRIAPAEAGDAAALAAAAHALAGGVLDTLQGWIGAADAPETRLAFATRGAVAAADGDVASPADAAAWGLVRTAQNEHPGRFVLVDEQEPDDELAARALASGAAQVAIRAGGLLQPGLRRVRSAPGAAPEAQPGTALVTGGTRGIGALVARRLAEQGAEHLLLVSRSGEAGAEPGLVDDLEAAGARVTVAGLDMADRADVARALELVPDDAPLRAVFHAAGTVRDGVVGALDGAALREVLAPKVDAVAHLDEQTRDLNLAEFVVLSSLAGVVGAPGQANYAAANAFLDAFAQRRRAEGRPAVSLAYGVWRDGGGMAAGLDGAQAGRLGEPLDPGAGLALLDAARGGDVAAPVLADLDAGRLADLAGAGVLPAVLEPLARRPAGGGGAPARTLSDRLAALDAGDREAEVLRLVTGEVAAVLGADAGAAIEAEDTFSDIGFDSLKGVELRNRLASATGIPLPPTLVFDRPTPAQVAALLLERAAPPDAGTAGVDEQLDRLAAALAAEARDGDRRAHAAERLRHLLRALESAEGDRDRNGADAGAAIGSATEDELYSFIETGLGISLD